MVLLSLFLVACSSENYVTTELQPLLEKELFGQNYKAYDALSKRESVISVVEIPKANFSENDLQNLKRGLLGEGWILKGENQGFYSYCKGKDKRIHLAIVNSHIMFDDQFNQYEFENLDNIVLSYRFYKYGVEQCI